VRGKQVHVQVVAVRFDPRYQVTKERVPEVKKHKEPIYEPYDVRVPDVEERVRPRLPWLE
jgi:hypothetical protein